MTIDPSFSGESATNHRNESVPGALRGEVWLNVQTYQAQSLIRGRRGTDGKPAIIGLIGFAERLKVLWQAVRGDDPFADWWLIKIEEGLADIRARLQCLQEQLESVVASNEFLEVTFAQSSRPQRVSLQFANPYAFRAAQMLADYDRMLCVWMTARHVGMAVPSDVAEQVSASGRWLRGVFALPQGYHSMDVTRSNVHQMTARAQQARERMGELPHEVLHGDRLPSLRPVTFEQTDASTAVAHQDV